MCTGDTTWADLEDLMKRWLDGERFGGGDHFSISAYGLSKAALMVFTMQMAAKYPNIKVRKNNFNVIRAKIKIPVFPLVHLCISGIHPD